MKKSRKVKGSIPAKTTPAIDHLNRQIPPEAHSPMYVWHKYWGRKTFNVVGEFIKTYCPEGGIVLDPFGGSGIVAIEALRANRRAIHCDLLPISCELTRLTIKPVALPKLEEAFKRVESLISSRILELYHTSCRKCGAEFAFTTAAWDGAECKEIRYESCPRCGDRRTSDCPPTNEDIERLRAIEATTIDTWYPSGRLYYPDGQPFMKKERFESLDELFTHRNLMALSWLMDAIEHEPSKDLKDFLKIAFSKTVHICSKLLAEGAPGYRPFSGVGWNQQSYWYAPRYLEVNVWRQFAIAVMGHQSLYRAKAESNEYYANKKITSDLDRVLSSEADLYIHRGDAISFLRHLVEDHGQCIDYIFTDPPYDAAVQYGELSYLWNAWLGYGEDHLETILAAEIVRNERQHKDFAVYRSLLASSLRGMFDVLKPERYATLTFHSPTFAVRNATINAAVNAGFELQKIHHQELARPSAKSLLQPFGSAQGDFYLRFHKPVTVAASTETEISARRFERIVVQTARKIIAERGEPTPYTILINAIDPELSRYGFFSQLSTGLDVQTVLKDHLGRDFVLVPMKIGTVAGESWWLQDPKAIPHLDTLPLSERVEETVLRKLQEWGRVTFTEMWKAISEEFPNSLTTDSTSIREALATYARPIGNSGEWMLKPLYQLASGHRIHTHVVVCLAAMGRARGHGIWIGRREQGDLLSEALPGKEGRLSQLVTVDGLTKLSNVSNAVDAEQIDVIWVSKNRVVAAFEVEVSTSMTESLKRGSGIATDVPKYMLLPEDRVGQLQRKRQAPLFGDAFLQHSWSCVFIEPFMLAYGKDKGKTSIEDLDKRTPDSRRVKSGQPGLFEEECDSRI